MTLFKFVKETTVHYSKEQTHVVATKNANSWSTLTKYFKFAQIWAPLCLPLNIITSTFRPFALAAGSGFTGWVGHPLKAVEQQGADCCFFVQRDMQYAICGKCSAATPPREVTIDHRSLKGNRCYMNELF